MTANKVLKRLQDEGRGIAEGLRDFYPENRRLAVASAAIVAAVLTFGFPERNLRPCVLPVEVGEDMIVVETCFAQSKLGSDEMRKFEDRYLRQNPRHGLQIEYTGWTFALYRISRR